MIFHVRLSVHCGAVPLEPRQAESRELPISTLTQIYGSPTAAAPAGTGRPFYGTSVTGLRAMPCTRPFWCGIGVPKRERVTAARRRASGAVIGAGGRGTWCPSCARDRGQSAPHNLRAMSSDLTGVAQGIVSWLGLAMMRTTDVVELERLLGGRGSPRFPSRPAACAEILQLVQRVRPWPTVIY